MTKFDQKWSIFDHFWPKWPLTAHDQKWSIFKSLHLEPLLPLNGTKNFQKYSFLKIFGQKSKNSINGHFWKFCPEFEAVKALNEPFFKKGPIFEPPQNETKWAIFGAKMIILPILAEIPKQATLGSKWSIFGPFWPQNPQSEVLWRQKAYKNNIFPPSPLLLGFWPKGGSILTLFGQKSPKQGTFSQILRKFLKNEKKPQNGSSPQFRTFTVRVLRPKISKFILRFLTLKLEQ